MDQQPPDFVPSPYSAPYSVPPAVRPGRGRRIAGAIATVVLGVLFVLAVAAFAWIHTSPTVESMVPQAVPVAASADFAWWWNAAAPVRRIPSVQQSLTEWQRDEHFSIDTDVLPWAGQCGFAMLHYDQQKPQMAIFLQVRNWIAFARFLREVETHDPGYKLNRGVKQTTYDGVPIATETEPSTGGGPVMTTQTAMLHGWYAVGIGAGSLEQVLDVYTGKQKSLSQSAAWKTAQGRLPANRVGWSAIRMDSLLSSIPQAAASKFPLGKLGYLTVTSFAAPETGMRWDAVSVPTNSATRQTLQQMAAAQTVAVTPAALKSAPNDTVAMLITSNATSRLNSLTDWVSSFVGGYLGAYSGSQAESMKSVKIQLAKLGNLNGLAELDLIVGADGTGGATAFADAATPQAAARTEAVFTQDWGATPVSPATAATMPVPKLGANFADLLQLATSIQGNRVQLASSGALLAPSLPTGAPYLEFPAEATGASWLAAGNFRFLLPARRWLAASDEAKSAPASAPELLDDLALDNAQWVTWARTDPSGGWQQQTTEISNWQWRAALSRLVDSYIEAQRENGGSPMTMPLQKTMYYRVPNNAKST